MEEIYCNRCHLRIAAAELRHSFSIMRNGIILHFHYHNRDFEGDCWAKERSSLFKKFADDIVAKAPVQ